MAKRFDKVRVLLRSGDKVCAWDVEVDWNFTPSELLADLLRALQLEGKPDDYELVNDGTLAEPRLVLTEKHPGPIGGVTPVPPGNE